MLSLTIHIGPFPRDSTPSEVKKLKATRRAALRDYDKRCDALTVLKAEHAKWNISKKNRDFVDGALTSILGPSRLVPVDGSLFSRRHNMKAHHSQVMIDCLFHWLLPPMLRSSRISDEYTQVVCRFFEYVRICCLRTTPAAMRRPAFARSVQLATERYLSVIPVNSRSVVTHSVVHLPRQLAWWGPVWICWMFPFER